LNCFHAIVEIEEQPPSGGKIKTKIVSLSYAKTGFTAENAAAALSASNSNY